MTWRRDLKSPTGNKRGTVRIRQFERVDSLDSVVACIAFPLQRGRPLGGTTKEG